MNELKNTKAWFEQAIPEPTIEQACIQIGCHYEEVSEMLTAMFDDRDGCHLEDLAHEYKQCSREHLPYVSTMGDSERKQLLDALADQIVTAVGVCHMIGFDIEGALAEVNRSNFSKFEDGKPVFDANGKITKGKHYTPPELGKFI
jgi:predicted HAD superfamily Cof-like phosphohydrolase